MKSPIELNHASVKAEYNKPVFEKKKKKFVQPLQAAWQQWYDALSPDAQSVLDAASARTSSTKSSLVSRVGEVSEPNCQSVRSVFSSDLAQAGNIDPTARDVSFRPSYSQYLNMAIFATSTLHRGLLGTVHAQEHAAIFTKDVRARLWAGVAAALGVSHVGATAPIPLNTDGDATSSSHTQITDDDCDGSGGNARPNPKINNSHEHQVMGPASASQSEPSVNHLDNGTNVLRSPTAFQLLHGDFGPPAAQNQPFSTELAARIFWARANQFGVLQVWSPLHTMFSAGNVREKERVLKKFPDSCITSSQTSSNIADNHDEYSGPITAVDLYAGIGYFALCYRRSGLAQVVLCWEINPWSIEGFRRGVEANKFPTLPSSSPSSPSECISHSHSQRQRQQRQQHQQLQIIAHNEHFNGRGELWPFWPADSYTHTCTPNPTSQPDPMTPSPSAQCSHTKHGFVMFAESNEHAWMRRIRFLRLSVPPIRHVNCGLLPTSAPSWETAVRALDPGLGGWVHAHENVAVQDIESRMAEIVARFQELVDGVCAEEVVLEAATGEGEQLAEEGRQDREDGWVRIEEGRKEGNVERPMDVKSGRWHAWCTQVFRVKTYAPGVMHCVFDIKLTPESD